MITLIIAGFSFAQNKSPAGKTYNASIKHGNLEREYRIYVPLNYDKKKSYPLLLALHGGGGNSDHMEKLTNWGFNKLADKEGFFVLYPEGIDKHWNDGRKGVNYKAHKKNIDDVGFLSALIDRFAKIYSIDKKRVYSTGISNGGLMSFRLACEIPEKIAAIAVVTACMPEDLVLTCSTARAVPVLVIDGNNDPLMPWDGGRVGFFGVVNLGRVLSVAETVSFWVKHNNCETSPAVTPLPDFDPGDGTKVTKEVYGNGDNNSEVVLYTVMSGGHTWPDGWQYLPESIIGKTSRDINANEAIWGFLKKHSIK